MGNLLEELGDVDAAQQWYSRALDLGDARARYHLGEIHARAGDLQPLRAWFYEGIDDDTIDPLALGHLLAQLGDLETLRTGLGRALAANKTPLAVNIGILLATHGDTDTVRVTFQQTADAGDKVPLGAIARPMLHFGHQGVVREWFRRAVDANDLVLIVTLGWMLYEAHHEDVVRAAIRALRERREDDIVGQLQAVTEFVDRSLKKQTNRSDTSAIDPQ
jgi:TPR repeat protein